jgi:DNA-binding PadR family transcriptional regulator
VQNGSDVRSPTIEGHLPLTPLSIHILLSLVDEERHGYGIMKEIERLTDGLATSATGPVYLAAQRLLEGGLIEESENRPAPEFDDQRRKYYRLTDLGQRVARAEIERMGRLVRVAFDKGLMQGSLSMGPGGTD